MTAAFDQRIVRASLQVANGQIFVYEGMDIRANGSKYTGSLMNTCQLKISNLTPQHRQYLLTEASPIARVGMKPVKLMLDVGRQSTGVFRLFQGDVFAGGVSQPPDIGIFLYSLTNNFITSQTVANAFDNVVDLKVIAQKVAEDNGLQLEYGVLPKNIENYSFTGSANKQIQELNKMGGVLAFVDNETLVVQNAGEPRGDTIREINAQTGMVGVPQPTSQGCTVTVMLDNTIVCGGQVRVKSDINPGCNGDYIVRKMDYEVAYRENPFFYTLECQSLANFTGTQ